jgi:SSS family solute:Na+ symporter
LSLYFQAFSVVALYVDAVVSASIDRNAPPRRTSIDTPTMILAGIGIYVLLMLALGIYASRGTQSITDFVVAGRGLPIWLCSVSIFATWFGSGIMMGAATSGYDRDFLLMIGEPFGSALALLLAGLFFARIMRRTRRMTWIQFFEIRYGNVAGVFGALADIVSGIIWMGGVLFTFGVLLESLAGLPMVYGIFGGVLIVVIYTMIGGMWAVALTDFLQTIVLVIGLVVLFVVVLDDVGGWSTIAAQLPEHTLRFTPVDHTYKNWIDYIHVWMTLGVAGLAANSIMQRALSAKSEGVAQNSFFIAATGYIFIGIIPLMLGLIASITMPGLADSNAVLADLALEHLHPIVFVIFVGAIVSAIMSTSDSVLLSVGSVISTNLLPRVTNNPRDRLKLAVARYSIPVTALLATYIAFGAENVVDVLIDSVAPLLAMTIVPFVLCFWWAKANKYGALAGIFGGLVGWLIAGLMNTVTPPDLIGFAVSAVSMVGVTLLTQESCPPQPLTDDEDNAVELTDRIFAPSSGR